MMVTRCRQAREDNLQKAKAHTEAWSGPGLQAPAEAGGLPSFHYALPGALQGTSEGAAMHLGSELPPFLSWDFFLPFS